MTSTLRTIDIALPSTGVMERCGSGPVFQTALVLGAVSATINLAAGLDTMADDLAATMSASRRHCVNGAFKAVEGHRSTSEAHLQRFVINIAADLHVAAKSDLLVWV
jgi:hypothetical protein